MAKVERADRLQAVQIMGESAYKKEQEAWVQTGEWPDEVAVDEDTIAPYEDVAERFARVREQAEQRGYERCAADVVAGLHARAGTLRSVATLATGYHSAAEFVARGEHIGAAERLSSSQPEPVPREEKCEDTFDGYANPCLRRKGHKGHCTSHSGNAARLDAAEREKGGE